MPNVNVGIGNHLTVERISPTSGLEKSRKPVAASSVT
jgi:hypothetical protein